MDMLNKYLDKCIAENELKEKTKLFVKASLAEKVKYMTRRRILTAVVSFAACAILIISGYMYYNHPLNYISLDINPSVELGVNAFNIVVSAEGINEDGTALTSGLKLRMMSVEEAINVLVQEASEKGYLEDDGSTVIAVTAGSENEDKALKLQEQSEQGVQLALEICKENAIIYADCSDLEFRTEARELGISPGKYKLVKVLQSFDQDITIDQLKDMKVSEIISMINEALYDAGVIDGLTDEVIGVADKICDAANRIIEANRIAEQNQYGNQEKDQNQEQNQNQDQSGERQEQNQEQNQNQDQSDEQQEQNQEQNQNQDQSDEQQEQNQEQNQNQDQSGEQQEQNQNKEQNQTTCETEQETIENTEQEQNTNSSDENQGNNNQNSNGSGEGSGKGN